jgi:hypothetical protein
MTHIDVRGGHRDARVRGVNQQSQPAGRQAAPAAWERSRGRARSLPRPAAAAARSRAGGMHAERHRVWSSGGRQRPRGGLT